MLAAPSYNSSTRLPPSVSHSQRQSTSQQSPLSSALSSPSESTSKRQPYLDTASSSDSTDSTVVLDTSDIPIGNIDLYMPNSYDFQSSPNSAYLLGLAETQDNLQMWSLNGGNASGVANQLNTIPRQGQNHQRHPSTSSIASTSSASPSTVNSQLAQVPLHGSRPSSAKQIGLAYENSRSQPSISRSHLPTPSQTPTRNTFIPQHSPSYAHPVQDLESAVAASMSMNQALSSSMAPPHRSSFSGIGSTHPSPLASSNDHARVSQHLVNHAADTMSESFLPKLHRTATDAYQDELYFPSTSASSQPLSSSAYLLPGSNKMVNERLLDAQMARSQSSGSSQSVPLSPFRSGYIATESDGHDVKFQMSPLTESEPKTISPKDAVYDYQANPNDMPLFPQSSAALTGSSYSAIAAGLPETGRFDRSSLDLNQGWASNMPAFSSAPMQNFNEFATPVLPPAMGMNSLSGHSGSNAPQGNRHSRRQLEPTPEFTPAQLTTMESSASEAPQSSAASSTQVISSPKPDSAADTGTYSCTYHGCLQRFTSPQKLQRHKRDSHRNSLHVTPGVGSGMSTAQLMERNSQSGPHICLRVNPTTGKPCNAIFSRPYDLTRHEDTIHNIRKQKVRCAICTEEKTFSRSDALTRHMRVVHPEVDFPGKHRKRGSRDD